MGHNARVLVVDDDEQIGRMFKTVLGDEGMEVDYVLSGNDAIERVKAHAYDIVFMDIVMPGLNGVQSLQRIREFNRDVKVVMMTGYSVYDLMEEATKYIVHLSLKKPVNVYRIMEVINDVVKRKNANK